MRIKFLPLTIPNSTVDGKALLRLTVLHNVPTACNRVTADFLISSPLFYESLWNINPQGARTSDSEELRELLIS